MIALSKLISFHFSLFFGSTVLFIGLLILFGGLANSKIVFVWLFFCLAVVTAVSLITKAYQRNKWTDSSTNIASAICLIGHAAPVSAFYLNYVMQHGPGSEILLIPIILLGALFYGIGIIIMLIKLSGSSKNIMK